MKTTTLRGLGIGLAAAFALTACTQGSAVSPTTGTTGSATAGSASDGSATGSPAGGETITYMNFSANGGNEENLAKIADAFTAESGIAVTIQTLPYADYFTALQTAVAGGTAADAFELNYENFVTYASNGSLAELADVPTDAYKPSLVEAFQAGGVQYGLPESFSNVVLFYNKDLFDAAGQSYPSADWTWADEEAAAKALTDTAAGVWGDYQPVTFHEFYKALSQSGGEFFNADKTEATFNSPEGVEAATWLVGKSGITMPTEADGAGTPDFDSKLFADGKLAMWHTGIWMFGGLADSTMNWDIAVEPGNTTHASAMFTNGVVVNAKSTKAEAAQKWLEFLTSSDVAASTRVEAGWELPPTSDEKLVADYLAVTPPDNKQAVFDSLDAVVLPPVIESQQEMQDIVSAALADAAAGRVSVQDALDSAADQVNELLK